MHPHGSSTAAARGGRVQRCTDRHATSVFFVVFRHRLSRALFKPKESARPRGLSPEARLEHEHLRAHTSVGVTSFLAVSREHVPLCHLNHRRVRGLTAHCHRKVPGKAPPFSRCGLFASFALEHNFAPRRVENEVDPHHPILTRPTKANLRGPNK